MRFPDKDTLRDKQLRRLDRELQRLWHALWEAPLIALEHPYQQGWIKTLRLREDITRRNDVALFRTVLAVVNDRLWCRNREFVHRDGHVMVLRPRIIGVGDWRKLAWPASHTRLFALGHWRDESERRYWRRGGSMRLFFGYRVTCPWAFEEEIRPYFVTHVRADLPEVRRRLSEIESFLRHREGRHRLNWLQGYSKRHWSDPSRRANLRAAVSLADSNSLA